MTRRKKYDNINKIFENRNCNIDGCKFPASRVIKVDGQLVYICGTHFALISDNDYLNRIIEHEPDSESEGEVDPHNGSNKLFDEAKGFNNGFKG